MGEEKIEIQTASISVCSDFLRFDPEDRQEIFADQIVQSVKEILTLENQIKL